MSEWCRSRRAPVCAAVFNVAYGLWSLTRVSSAWWQWRDDGVITLSHARGLANFGYPAVSAAAERVEGTSAPLQMFAGAVYYRLGGDGWQTFMDVQLVLGFAAAGWFTARLIAYAIRDERVWIVVPWAAAVAVVAFSTWPALGWFGSGMENSLTVPLLLAATATAIGLLTIEKHRGWACGIAFALGGITRVDFAALLLPALLVVITMLSRARRDAALRVALIALPSWCALHTWRWCTFHSLLPNSALAQGKRAINTANLVGLLLAGIGVGAVLLTWRRPRLRAACAGVLAGVALFVSFSARWTGSKTSIGGLPTAVVVLLSGLTVLATVAWALGVASPRVWAPFVAIGVVPVAQELLFGPARLDAARIGAQSLPLLAPLVGIIGGTLTGRCACLARPTRTRLRAPTLTEMLAGAAVTVVCALGVQSLAIASARSKPYNLCCEIPGYTTVLARADEHAHQVGLPRSITATPDLGKFSFGQSEVVVDLGRLGDALLAEIRDQRPELVDDYLNDVAVPDFIEIHGMWACNVYPAWLASPEFKARYDVSGTPPGRGGTANCSYGGSLRFYERSGRDPTYAPEIALAAELASHPTDAEALVTSAADQCRNQPDRWACQTVRRAIQRAAPELRQAGTFDDAVAALGQRSPTGQIDELLLDTPPGWADTVAPMLISLLEDPT